jgi:hypothetical protein
MKELRQCIRELRTMRDEPIRDVVLPIIAALEAVNARIAARCHRRRPLHARLAALHRKGGPVQGSTG